MNYACLVVKYKRQ